MTMPSPTEYYDTRIRAEERQVSELRMVAGRISVFRRLTFGVWVVLFLLGVSSYVPMEWAWGLGGLTFVGFVVLLAKHELVTKQIRAHEHRIDIASGQLARMARRWSDVRPQDIDIPGGAVTLSDDLDLFGHASLYQLLCRAHTPRGRALLRDWILTAASPEEIAGRRESIEQLAPLTDFREELDLRGRVLSSSAAGPRHFVEWGEGASWLRSRRWLLPLCRASVATFIGGIALGILGVIAEPVAVVVCLFVVCLNLALSVLLVGAVHDIFEKVDSRHRDIEQYQLLFGLFRELSDPCPQLRALQDQMTSQHGGAGEAMRRLERIMNLARMRHSSAVGIIHLFLQLLFLVDFHILGMLEGWQARYGNHVRGWFESLGTLEALSSFASLHFDHPEWAFAKLSNEASTYDAVQLGHPLLATPVRNDVTIGPAGRFLLVSGSNMSGKSTLMRSIGLNAILAQAGAPVCATSLSLFPVEIATSMRIQDSLEDGISFFMAELQRLKSVVDQALALKARSGATLLFLLDEILQGTNSAERHIAVRRVVHRLTQCGATGAISTHDLELANSDDLNQVCDAVHFRESFDAEGSMTFDYVMRPGVATSTNALKLLEMVGIE